MTPPITIVERATSVSVLGHLDELERLMREYLGELESMSDDAVDIRRLAFSGFLIWLRQRQRQSAATANVFMRE